MASNKKFSKINSHNEWDKLKEIIVGTAQGTMSTLTWRGMEPPKQEILDKAYKLAKDSCPKWFYDEVEEDLDNLASLLKSLGVVVHRPKPFDFSKMYGTPFWQSTSNNTYNTRDLHLVVGNTVIESPSYSESRYYEATSMYHIWYEYFEQGFKWVAAPKPVLDYEVLVPYFRSDEDRILTEEDLRHKELTEDD